MSENIDNNDSEDTQESEDDNQDNEPTYAQQVGHVENQKQKDLPLVYQWIKDKGFDLKEAIGTGQFSTVYKASWTQLPNRVIACKRIQLDDVDKDWKDRCLKNELVIVKKLKHKNITEVHEVFKTQSLVYIFMQFCKNGSILEYMTKMKYPVKENQAKVWFSELMAGLSYMHSKGVAHRDIKLDNFLLDDNYRALLSDFGFAVIDEKNDRMLKETMCGTPAYMAPEVHKANKKSPYNPKISDLYSMGICLFEMINYDKPFRKALESNNLSQLIREKNERKYRFHSKIDDKTSADIKDLVYRLLEPNPKKRITTKQILRHKALQ